MNIKLVFDDWKKKTKSIYHTKEGFKLSSGQFHSGSTFDGEINLGNWEEKELREAIENGYQPVFWVTQ